MAATTTTARAGLYRHHASGATEEYIDYSCSTSVERLARDVETLLRTWHVDRGSDRHVSVTTTKASNEHLIARHHHPSVRPPPPPQQEQQQPPKSPLAPIPNAGSGSESGYSTSNHVGKGNLGYAEDTYRVAVIRSDTIRWNVGFHYQQQQQQQQRQSHYHQHHEQSGQRFSCTIDLQLVLWDRPDARNRGRKRTNDLSFRDGEGDTQDDRHHHHPIRDYEDDDDDDEYDQNRLPFALQRKASRGMDLPLDLLDNFSTLFGIGQHITLSPTQPENVPMELVDLISTSVLSRHENNHIAGDMVLSVLTGWLQAALNLAASYCQCCFPLIGVWGKYNPMQIAPNGIARKGDKASVLSVFPSWMESFANGGANNNDNKYRKKRGLHSPQRSQFWARSTTHVNTAFLPPIVAGRLHSEECTATFWCGTIREDKRFLEPTRWTTWSSVLQKHCKLCAVTSFREQASYTIGLWAARHVYSWYKDDELPTRRSFLSALGGKKRVCRQWRSDERRHRFRQPTNSKEEAEWYRQECRNIALSLLEEAAGSSEENPLWGPCEDPISSFHAIVTWNSPRSPPLSLSSSSSPAHGMEMEQVTETECRPLIVLPLKTRTKISLEDTKDMENSIASNVFDLQHPSKFHFKSYYDMEATEAPLAATQRCVLAALIRAATLPRETLNYHLIDTTIVGRWDIEAGNRIANSLAIRASVDDATCALVDAMDWGNAIENMIDHSQAEERVLLAMDSSWALKFPSPPDQILESLRRDDWKALHKSSPPGRLLSLLFLHMASVRSPPSMALIWSIFVQELRQRWDRRESLPNMNYVPGLDPPVESMPVKKCFSSVGSRADLAAQLYCSEPDPDDSYCLIGQKLQVFNICLENVVANKMREIEVLEKKRAKLDAASGIEAAIVPKAIIDNLPEVRAPLRETTDSRELSQTRDSDNSTIRSRKTAMSAFFDAEEGSVSVLDSRREDYFGRQGARCPVQGAYLLNTGDQVYAPYLQRALPLTDDLIAQRQMMMRRQQGMKASVTIKQRIEIAQRLQKPKLISDMQAFKAANPGAEFEDFVAWYGNPENPLEGFDPGDGTDNDLSKAASAPIGMKLDKAAEAIKVLDETRKFWIRTWDEARPVPAIDQDSLFDAATTVEMLLDFLETIHPAVLLCQVMAVNLAMAYFTLVVSAQDAVMIGAVRVSLARLREHVITALGLLSRDATIGSWACQQQTGDPLDGAVSNLVSIDSMSSCAQTCIALSEAEVLVARARSFLHKLPGEYRLIDRIMSQQSDGALLEVSESRTRNAILRSVEVLWLQNKAANGTSTSQAMELGEEIQPTIREYVFLNDNDQLPCQLSVKYRDKSTTMERGGSIDVLLALTTCVRHGEMKLHMA